MSNANNTNTTLQVNQLQTMRISIVSENEMLQSEAKFIPCLKVNEIVCGGHFTTVNTVSLDVMYDTVQELRQKMSDLQTQVQQLQTQLNRQE